VKSTRRIPATLAALAVTLLACALFAVAASAAPRIDTASATGGVAPRINPSGSRGASSSTSVNWSGYSATGGLYNSVTATWTQPSVVPRTTQSFAAFWVGLDGDGSDSVEQIGTMGYTAAGKSYYSAWYEMYPEAMVEIRTLTIRPGDVLTATVEAQDATAFKLTLQDQTTGQVFTTTETSTVAQRASAEVIAEAPSDSTGVLPLATFGLASFSNCAVDGDSLATSGAVSIDMVKRSGTVLAATSALNADGTGFTVSDDFTAPRVTPSGLQSSATSGWKNAAVKVKLQGSDGTGGSGVAAVYYSVDGGETQTYSGPFTVSDADSHAVKYWAVDNAGNTGGAKTGYVNLDLAAPSALPGTISMARREATRGAAIAIPVTLVDPLPSSGTVTLVARIVAPSGKTVARVTRAGVAANSTKTLRVRLKASLKRDVYTVRTRATDAAGNAQARAGKARLRIR
jgi:hypothetical protein